MATLFAPFKVLALSVAAIILALTPISALIFWVESSSEVVYSSPDYSVVYKPNILNTLTGSNETRVKIEVRDSSGKPLEFVALLSGPTSEGVIEVGTVGGKGQAVKSVGRYVAEVRKALQEANSDPERSGLGMLMLLSSIIEENGGLYSVADAVSVPIIPGKAIGKEIVVTVKFKPIMKHKISKDGGTGASQTTLREVAGPPEKIRKCTYYFGVGNMCNEWRLAKILYTTPLRLISGEQVVGWDYIPVAITELNDYIGSKTAFLLHDLRIKLRKVDIISVSFDLSMGWTVDNKISLYAPGPGYTIYIKEDVQEEAIYRSTCMIYSTLTTGQSYCKAMVNDTYVSGHPVSKFTGNALFSNGFDGRLWLARYELYYVDTYYQVEYRVRDDVIAVWMEPRFNEYGKIVAKWELDDNLNDGYGITEKVVKTLKPNITYSEIGIERRSFSLFIVDIYVRSEASALFGAGIPVGALIMALAGDNPAVAVFGPIAIQLSIGIEAEKYTAELYKTLGYFMVELVSSDQIKGYYATFTNTYEINGESAKKAVPLIFFRPT